MGRHWFNNLARDTRDLEYLHRVYGPKTEEEKKRRVKTFTCAVYAIGAVIALFIILIFVISISEDQKKKPEPTAVSAPLGAAPVVESAPDAQPEPTSDSSLLIRYEADGQCLIKGNINGRGAKIYHVPGSTAYEATKIDEAAGERWFCTEQEAIDAGWHAPGK